MTEGVRIGPFTEADYPSVAGRVEEWGGAASVKYFVLRRFLHHFGNTCFLAEVDGQVVGWLIGWLSQSRPGEAFINSVAVSPAFRNRGIASALYGRFFHVARDHGRTRVTATIRPSNDVSLAFHRRLGFRFREVGAEMRKGIPVLMDWDGPGEDKVLAEIDLSDPSS